MSVIGVFNIKFTVWPRLWYIHDGHNELPRGMQAIGKYLCGNLKSLGSWWWRVGLKHKASGRQTYITYRVRHSCTLLLCYCSERRTIATGELPCSANPVMQLRFYTDPLLSWRSPVCVRLLQSRAGTGSAQGVLPDKIQDDFAVCAGLS